MSDCGCDDCGSDNIQLDVVNGEDGDSVSLTSGTTDPSGPPSTAAGLYTNTSTGHIWQWISGGSSWVDLGQYLGIDGDPGDDGSGVESDFATADPSSPTDDPATGNSAIWFNTSSGHIWFFPVGGPWADQGSYVGADGADGAGYGGTSTSSLTIGTGFKTLTIQAGLAYLPGLRIRVANDGANWMEGAVTAYDIVTGVLSFTSSLTLGSGTFAVWNVGIAGERGATGVGSAGPAGTTPTIRSGTGVPSNGLGVDGDQYIQQVNPRFFQWYAKSSGAYSALATGYLRVGGYLGQAPSNPNLLGLGTNWNPGDHWTTLISGTFTIWTWNGSAWIAAPSFSISSGGSGAFDVYRRIDGAGGTDIRFFGGSGGVAVPFGTPVLLDATSFTNVNDTTHEVESPGRYHIEANVGVIPGSGNPRITVWLELSTGSGPYAEILGSRRSAYASGEKGEDGTAHTSIIVPLVGNDRIKVMASAGIGNVRQMLARNASSISMMKVG